MLQLFNACAQAGRQADESMGQCLTVCVRIMTVPACSPVFVVLLLLLRCRRALPAVPARCGALLVDPRRLQAPRWRRLCLAGAGA